MMEASATTATRATPALGVARRRWSEDVIKALLILAALISILTTTGIVLSLARETVVFFEEVGLVDFLFGTEWSPVIKPQSFGVLPLVSGTLLITAVCLVVAIPLGLGSAVYLSEYAHVRVRKIVKPILETLAGVPTIVFGYFALTFFTPNFLQDFLNMEVSVFNALSAGLIMGFMVMPTIASVAEDAMSAVPASLREGSFGLGANRLQTSLRVVFPAALSGIVASVVLGASRAIGETMIVLVAAGQIAALTANPENPMYTMTSYIAAMGKGDLATGSLEYKTIFAVGMLLFVITLLLNLVAIRFVRKYRQVYE